MPISLTYSKTILIPKNVIDENGHVNNVAFVHVLVKGGVFLEEIGKLKALAVDKTGTITEGKPRVQQVIPWNGKSEEEIVRVAAAIDTHSEHPLAQAVVKYAEEKRFQFPRSEGYQSQTGRGAEAQIDGHLYFVGNHRLAHESAVCSDALEKKLREAFAGESKAFMRNLAFAKKAEEDGFPQVALLFRAVADAEKVHADEYLKYLEGVIGETEENLKAAFENEIKAKNDYYPAFIKEAFALKREDVAWSFSRSRDVEERHAKLYKDALEALLKERDIEDHVCQVCGYTLNPDRPYDDPRVNVYINDGRSFIRNSTKKYDLIIFALPDSWTLTSSYSSLRLESFLHVHRCDRKRKPSLE